MKKTPYTEPVDFIPKDIRKKMKIGEFAEEQPRGNDSKITNEEFREYVKGGDKKKK